jgi:ubiquinone/menaquinone biosynthesis C-methylase UbiE
MTTTAQPQAVLAFNHMANDYDDHFTRSLIGRAQRSAVWEVALQTFHQGDCILELNCGTGEDALFLTQRGISVVACDASDRMIQVARSRHRAESPNSSIEFHHLPIEQITVLQQDTLFDGAFSNFSGLNCVKNLQQTAQDLASLIRPGAPVLLCMSTRFCIWEIFWFLAHGNARKAFRRCSGHTTAKVSEFSVDVYYPTVRKLQSIFSPYFTLHACTGIGVAVPPSYVETSICRYPKILQFLRSLDKTISGLPGFRVIGDHVLLSLKRSSEPAPAPNSAKV